MNWIERLTPTIVIASCVFSLIVVTGFSYLFGPVSLSNMLIAYGVSIPLLIANELTRQQFKTTTNYADLIDLAFFYTIILVVWEYLINFPFLLVLGLIIYVVITDAYSIYKNRKTLKIS